ncbi:MAG: DNA-binding protein [Chloroflexi bacterium HGW-Chloroflexi-8]|nr:MAG: DNA-binding protein [Chloroflexi bacterium HGW-Chloroflexi-8]
MNITVFGGSAPRPESPEYEFAYDLGKNLATAGHTVLTGGYMGIMEAVSKGAAESNGHVIGITCEEIERWRHNGKNLWVKEEWRLPTLHDRILKLIDSCDIAIALPGGPGTLAEIVLMWNRIQIEVIPPKPIIIVGEGWKKVFHVLYQEQAKYINENYMKLLHFVNTNEDILSYLINPNEINKL